MDNKRLGKVFLLGIVGLIIVCILCAGLMSCRIVDTGYVGIHTRLGKAIGVKDAGLNFVVPFIDDLKKMEIREQTIQNTYSVSSKDMQTITMALNVQFSIGEDPLSIYEKFGLQYNERLIHPRISESLNAVSARYTIEEFITKRNDMAKELLNEVLDDVSPYKVSVSSCSIIEHDFSDEFDRAIESKLVASQNALTAQNNLERVKYEAEAEIVKAKGIADANKLMQQSLTPLLIQRMAIEKWNGQLPNVTGDGSIPMINLK